MFGLSIGELVLIGVIALIVLGPERLPTVARAAGKYLGKAQRMISSVKEELSSQLELDELKQAKNDLFAATEELKSEMLNLEAVAKQNASEISRISLGEESINAVLDDDSYQPIEKINDHSNPEYFQNCQITFQTTSITKKSKNIRRDVRPKIRIKPKLRVRSKGNFSV